MPMGLSRVFAIVYGNYVYVVGGLKVFRLDLTNPTGAWDDAGVSDLPESVTEPALAIVGSKLYVLGGNAATTYKTVYVLDLANPAGEWSRNLVSDLPDSKYAAAAVYFNNHVFLTGGYDPYGNVTANTYMLRTNENVEDRSKLYDIGQDIKVQLDRYGYRAGKNMKLIGLEVNHETEEIMLDVWG
jgi:N-acetylneuraminic acid mutarotase